MSNGKLSVRDICLEGVAARHGTPFYLYDLETVHGKIFDVRRAFGEDVELFYAVKANPNGELLRGIQGIVAGVDVSSGGEVRLALAAGFAPSQVSFAGPGKTRRELELSLAEGIGFLSVESFSELELIEALVRGGARRASVMLRVNPKLLIKEFAVKMGGKASPFGIDEEELPHALEVVRRRPEAFDFQGVHVYSGTQCLEEEQLACNLSNTLAIAARTTTQFKMECRTINIGGGFGVPYYAGQRALDLAKLASLFRREIQRYRELTGTRPRILLELGRFLVAEAGLYVARVVSEKRSRGEHFVVLDGGMNHHLAASGNMGAAVRKNFQVRNLSRAGAPAVVRTLVGPLCTPLDVMGKDVSIEEPKIGDLIGFLFSGSYGYSASPLRFLGHEEPREVVVRSATQDCSRS